MTDVPGRLTDEELAKWERRCEQARKRADRRCVAREELRIDARELAPFLAAVRGQGEALRPFRDLAQRLVDMDDPRGSSDRQTITLNALIEQARAALDGPVQ